jgi:hypothetical protein
LGSTPDRARGRRASSFLSRSASAPRARHTPASRSAEGRGRALLPIPDEGSRANPATTAFDRRARSTRYGPLSSPGSHPPKLQKTPKTSHHGPKRATGDAEGELR